MGRKPKCTVEEKISAVEDYLNEIRSVSEIMVDLSIKSTRTIRNWILAYQNGGIKADYVLMDTWFTTEPKLKNILDTGIHAIGRVKQLQQRYTYNGRQYTQP